MLDYHQILEQLDEGVITAQTALTLLTHQRTQQTFAIRHAEQAKAVLDSAIAHVLCEYYAGRAIVDHYEVLYRPTTYSERYDVVSLRELSLWAQEHAPDLHARLQACKVPTTREGHVVVRKSS